jgi:hypothetical protein
MLFRYRALGGGGLWVEENCVFTNKILVLVAEITHPVKLYDLAIGSRIQPCGGISWLHKFHTDPSTHSTVYSVVLGPLIPAVLRMKLNTHLHLVRKLSHYLYSLLHDGVSSRHRNVAVRFCY